MRQHVPHVAPSSSLESTRVLPADYRPLYLCGNLEFHYFHREHCQVVVVYYAFEHPVSRRRMRDALPLPRSQLLFPTRNYLRSIYTRVHATSSGTLFESEEPHLEPHQEPHLEPHQEPHQDLIILEPHQEPHQDLIILEPH